jgi:hypothetical protein
MRVYEPGTLAVRPARSLARRSGMLNGWPAQPTPIQPHAPVIIATYLMANKWKVNYLTFESSPAPPAGGRPR